MVMYWCYNVCMNMLFKFICVGNFIGVVFFKEFFVKLGVVVGDYVSVVDIENGIEIMLYCDVFEV